MQCVHPLCTCEVAGAGTTCSPACSANPSATSCGCGHPTCGGIDKGIVEIVDDRVVDGDVFDPLTVGESMTAPGTTVEYDDTP